jgi:hypothetical protein
MRELSMKFQVRNAVFLIVLSSSAFAQGPPGGPPQPPRPPKAAAPIDLTGYWVSLVTEDWRYRMLTPAKGDYASVPINPEGKKVADAWDPAKDEASGNACKAFGAPGLTRQPGRLHITWDNDSVLKVEFDAGTQTRMLNFPKPAATAEASWQGVSEAKWELAAAQGGGGRGGPPVDPMTRGGSLKVVTTHFKPGYLRKNGVPYSADATLTEYFSVTNEPNGDHWLIITSVVEDPKYLTQPFITSTHFKKQADGSGWSPSPCTAK